MQPASLSLSQLATLHAPGKGAGGASGKGEPLHVFSGHTEEGYGLDWSTVAAGSLASSDCAGAVSCNIYIYHIYI